MSPLLTFLLTIINLQNDLIQKMYILLVGKVLFKPRLPDPIRKDYRKLEIDDLPLMITHEKMDYKELLQAHFKQSGKVLKPVKRRTKSTVSISSVKICPRCDAPADYLYANNGTKGQCWCKVCDFKFNDRHSYRFKMAMHCPHCERLLSQIKERHEFFVYKCANNSCSYYISKLNQLTSDEKEERKTQPEKYKVRYITREFTFDFQPMQERTLEGERIDFTRLHSSPNVVGLILTYHVNYGITARKTAQLMKDVHGLSISHQTVLNYARLAAKAIKPLIDHHPYDLSDQICGDETYIRVLGKWNYLFFFFDAKNKIILSYRLSPNRDTPSAIQAIDDVLVKLGTREEKVNLIVDGNPIYLLAQHFFSKHQIYFDVTQVIGLTNEDPVSTEYRPLKQIIERLNRTFKGGYKPTHGFGSFHGSESHITLFVAYFNFLRKHSALENRTPVDLPMKSGATMPQRWCQLIEQSQQLIIHKNLA
ncbi:DDE-type integrase/transposase/recombinase [Paenisporosarcina sp. TG20]|uniref:DDE-type integrase/transposase/recombinase n=1 Tax=Paenisporosarcina sp. TG20 TaxID=1211706 RepID=UPI0002D790D2|nr:DDE-type integrase/transposase/recombinase [Paenisporosarcina sp. TG20]